VGELVRRVEADELRGAQAERMLGYLTLGGKGLSPATQRRRRKELREHGLVLADPLGEEIAVDLAEGIEAAVDAWSRG
jgi:hypothetical protein